MTNMSKIKQKNKLIWQKNSIMKSKFRTQEFYLDHKGFRLNCCLLDFSPTSTLASPCPSTAQKSSHGVLLQEMRHSIKLLGHPKAMHQKQI